MEKKTYQDYIQEIDLPSFIGSFGGYSLDMKESTRNDDGSMKYYVFRLNGGAGKETLVVNRSSKTGQWIYKSRHDGLDKGNIINFLRNRVTGGAKEINEILSRFTGGMQINAKVKISMAVASKVENKDFRQYLKPLSESALLYFKGRGISEDTLKHKYFRRAVCSDEKNNAIFPIRNSNLEIKGLDCKNFKTFSYMGKHTFKGSEKMGNMWVSDFDQNAPVEKIVIGEHGLDLMSRFQMHAEEYTGNVIFMSPCGEFGAESIIMLNKFIERYNPEKIETAFDNDAAGLKFTAYIMGYSVMKGADDDLRIHFGYTAGNSKIVLNAEALNTEAAERVKKQMAGHFIVGEGKITENGGENRTVVSLIINNTEAAKDRVLDFILFARGIEKGCLIINKPRTKDFNQDLCEKLGVHPFEAVRLEHDFYRATVEAMKINSENLRKCSKNDEASEIDEKLSYYEKSYTKLCEMEKEYNERNIEIINEKKHRKDQGIEI